MKKSKVCFYTLRHAPFALSFLFIYLLFTEVLRCSYLYDHCWLTVDSLLTYCWLTVDSLLTHCWLTVDSLLIHCWLTVDSLLTHCWLTVDSLLTHCSLTVDSLLTHCRLIIRIKTHYNMYTLNNRRPRVYPECNVTHIWFTGLDNVMHSKYIVYINSTRQISPKIPKTAQHAY